MITGNHEEKIKELQLKLRMKGILKSIEEIFNIMINLVKEKFS